MPATIGLPNLLTALNDSPGGAVIKSGDTVTSMGQSVHRVRGVCSANQSVTAFVGVSGGTPQDGLTYAAGDRVFLANQSTSAQNGIYVVGAVSGGVAALTRADDMPAGMVLLGGCIVEVNAGTLFAGTSWKCMTAGPITVGTTTSAWYPARVVTSSALTAGTVTITTIPILSATKSHIGLHRIVGDTCTATTGGYHPTVGNANGITPGVVGTASLVIQATVAAGTINVADVSTLSICVTNW